MSGPLLIATRNADKLREVGLILGATASEIELLDLDAAGVPASRAEDELEAFDTFEENALAKARYFAALTGLPVLADDSGLCVDALGGAPGVRSRRFSGREDLRGPELDRANNARLLDLLSDTPDDRRAAHYVCVIALTSPAGQERTFRGECHGSLLRTPRGSGGFGYDPLFYLPAERATFGELPPERKNALSHRAIALRAAAEALASGAPRKRGRVP